MQQKDNKVIQDRNYKGITITRVPDPQAVFHAKMREMAARIAEGIPESRVRAIKDYLGIA